ncbi:MAG: FAD-dependent oxidoreductase [Chloroflexi bacterium]|nr:FAD-dependent oxidoreductase [Chloroflexota bacterium]
MSEQFKYLFTPLQVGSMEVPNRLVCLPTTTGFGQDGRVTPTQVSYVAERAKGGAGMVIVAGFDPHPSCAGFGRFAAYRSDYVPEFRAVADAAHRYGARAIAQISHSGRQATSFFGDRALWAMSAIPCPAYREMPHEMDLDEIRETVDYFAQSAANMEAAAFDGVELHGGHGYLLQQAMSPWSNHRTDSYGGSLENRTRLVLEVIDAIRASVAPSFVLGIRISADELQPGGLDMEEMSEIARILEATRKIDYISVSFAGAKRYILDMSAPVAPLVFMAARIREVVDLPVIASQRINDPLLAEKILADGHADLIGMARALICDPELPNKAKQGRLDDIRACIACLQECRRTAKGGLLGCTQNPAVGKEAELGIGTIKPAAIKKKVVVIGGGPGGMEAARVAALRGHAVTLYEKNTQLGGQVNIAALAPGREEIGGVVRYLSGQMAKLGVKVNLCREADLGTVLDEQPDAVVVATGSVPFAATLEADGGPRVASVWDILEDKFDVGDKVVVVDGGEAFWQMASAAEFLAARGKQVVVMSHLYFVGTDIPAESLSGLYQRFARAGVQLSPLTRIRRVEGNTLVVGHVYTGEERQIPDVDAVVMATGSRACDDLYKALKGKVKELHAVGDCVAPRKIPEAIREGYFVGRAL